MNFTSQYSPSPSKKRIKTKQIPQEKSDTKASMGGNGYSIMKYVSRN